MAVGEIELNEDHVPIAHQESGDLTEEASSWKTKLSVTFNEEQIVISLLIFGIFYVGYATANAFFNTDDDNLDDDDKFIQSCYCELNQRLFYRTWFYFWCAVWFLIHTYVFLAQAFSNF